jgi:hypothetical protein
MGRTEDKKKRNFNPKCLANLKSFKPGESGNQKSRGPQTAGASIRQWMNAMSGYLEAELRHVSQSARFPAAKRAAALQMLRAITSPDMADFAEVLAGEKTLPQARAAGIDTTIVKRFAVRPTAHGTSRELELHDHAGDAIDRIMDRTEGKPKQTTEIMGEGGMPLAITITTPQTRLAAACPKSK